jgi:hypothetical protein
MKAGTEDTSPYLAALCHVTQFSKYSVYPEKIAMTFHANIFW